MVLYMSMVKGGKSEKTNWVMHQYHIGTGEDEKDGEFVVSKVFYQQQVKQCEKIEEELPLDIIDCKRKEMLISAVYCILSFYLPLKHPETSYEKEEVQPERDNLHDQDHIEAGNTDNQMVHDHDNHTGEDPKWWEGESQFPLDSQQLVEGFLLDSQQLVEGLSLCDEFLQSQSSNVDGDDERKVRSCLSDYARLGAEDLKKDLEECQSLGLLGPANIELDTTPDFRLSQLEFESQESFTAWGGSKVGD
ncbi:hypothetical protein HHK36_029822 [Tetracentron sinense]|uniref:NAC domain-containing protein n=1 Tax=Tetracentron sinense TaxID=13715 RepID=A0A834YFY8_TETSI|nr:hypothetical protein HHK36_029822 [Tetracentron sinense]